MWKNLKDDIIVNIVHKMAIILFKEQNELITVVVCLVSIEGSLCLECFCTERAVMLNSSFVMHVFLVSCERPFVHKFFIAFGTIVYNIYYFICASRIGVVREIRFFLRAIVDFL